MKIEIVNVDLLKAAVRDNFADQQQARALAHQIAELGISLEDRAETGLSVIADARSEMEQLESLLNSLKVVWARWVRRDDVLAENAPLTPDEWDRKFGVDVRPDTSGLTEDDLSEMLEQVAMRG